VVLVRHIATSSVPGRVPRPNTLPVVAMQHDERLPPPGLAPSLLDHMDALWPSLGTDGRRALRECSTAMRDAVDARVSSLEALVDGAEVLSPATCAVLSSTTCDRLHGVHTLVLRSMACLRGMVLARPPSGAPHDPGRGGRARWAAAMRCVCVPCRVAGCVVWAPYTTTTNTLLCALQGGAVIEDAADYQAIARAAPWLIELSMMPPTNATALPQQMAALLRRRAASWRTGPVCTKRRSQDCWTSLAAGTQLLRLSLPSCSSLTNLAPLAAMVYLQSLSMAACSAVSDLAPLVNLQSLDISGCNDVSVPGTPRILGEPAEPQDRLQQCARWCAPQRFV
jgi:hypothetical protein